jgi:ATP-dependent RNA helicase DOB1
MPATAAKKRDDDSVDDENERKKKIKTSEDESTKQRRGEEGDGRRRQSVAKTDEDFLLKSGCTRIPPANQFQHGCLHDMVCPPNYQPSTKKMPKVPAKQYPFELDTFQQQSVLYLERQESVLVSAHTSAGKTVVAEYAIAMAKRDGQRVVYTSPLKALSNQKYRELKEEFSDVGLMTGDTVINPNASCLVMTTEVLRSMLYKGGEVTREVGWVIYDEIHYMRDKERGVVWEESIVLLPDTVKYVFLSATIPNAREFSEWVCKVHNIPCHIVYTDFRPTPLEHYIYPSGGEGIFLIVDRTSAFKEDNFLKAISIANEKGAEVAQARTAARKASEMAGGDGSQAKLAQNTDVFKIIKMIVDRNYDPVIVFAFNKGECESFANALHKVDLCDENEKDMIDAIYWNAMDALSESDKKLPQVASMPNLLRRGLGVHHSGLLPILKEVIEILFQEGLIKVLFATETMSVGLNMPARTCVFASPRKFDGNGFRWITSGEYTQMSGRAGRRGKDDRGLVVLMVDEKMDAPTAKDMLRGRSDPLDSAFHVSYATLLNLMRVEGAEPEDMIMNSFAQFQSMRRVPQLEAKVALLEKKRDEIEIDNEEQVNEYVKLRDGLDALTTERRAITNLPTHSVPFLQPGRLVRVCVDAPGSSLFSSSDAEALTRMTVDADDVEEMLEDDDVRNPLSFDETMLRKSVEDGNDSVWGVIVHFEKVGSKKHSKYLVDVLVKCAEKLKLSDADRTTLKLNDPAFSLLNSSERHSLLQCEENQVVDELPAVEFRVVRVPLEQLDCMSSIRVYLPKDLHPLEARVRCGASVREVLKRFEERSKEQQNEEKEEKVVIPMLDAEKDMKVTDKNYAKTVQKIQVLSKMMKNHGFKSSGNAVERLRKHVEKRRLEYLVRHAKKEVTAASGMIKADVLKRMRRVLRRLGYVSEDGVVTQKGRCACELAGADELVATELIFNGTFKALPLHMLVATVSCLVWKEKTGGKGGKDGNGKKQGMNVSEEVFSAHSNVKDAARKVFKQQLECKLKIDVEDSIERLRWDLMEVMLAWCKGNTFSEIMKMTEAFEGSIVRAIRRIEELMRQLASACKVIGESDLEKKFLDACELVKRDIVFTPSLFV